MILLLIILLFFIVPGAKAADDVFLKAMQEELKREYKVLKENKPPVYYIAYRAEEVEKVYFNATLGILSDESILHLRNLSVQIKIGSPQMDNTHEIKGSDYRDDLYMGSVSISIEDDEDVIKRDIWKLAHEEFMKGLARYEMVIADEKVMAKAEDQSDDYTLVEPKEDIRDITFPDIDRNKWKEIIKKVSAVFRDYLDIYSSTVDIEIIKEIKYYLDSSGTVLKYPHNYIRLYIFAFTRSEDGMPLFLHSSYSGFNEQDIPGEKELVLGAKELADKLIKLKDSAIVEPYTGPAIFLSKAAGVFFHEVLGHRLEGDRQKSEKEGQTFTKKVNKKIVSPIISIVDDPTKQYYQDKPLLGFYCYDDEGIPAQKAILVEEGILKGFLMGRSPIKNFKISNGHGRSEIGEYPMARQANLIITAKETVAFSELRQMLVNECKKRNKPYGLIFADVSGGFTFTSRRSAQAFKVLPLEVYKVYADGKQDELVRGVDIVGTPLTALEKIIAASDTSDVFNGFCGAESGTVPVSVVSPAILVSEIEVEKKIKDMRTLPILTSPLYEDKK